MNTHLFCPICASQTPESQKQLRYIVRLGLARLLNLARSQGLKYTPEQIRKIYDTLVNWDPGGVPDAFEWHVREQAVRAASCAQLSFDDNCVLIQEMRSSPDWTANLHKKGVWDLEAEHAEAEQLARLLGDADD